VAGRGGGIAIIHRDTVSVAPLKITFSSPAFDHLAVTLSIKSSCVNLVVIYRPPSPSFEQFLSDFASYLELLSASPIKLFIVGDFNIHVDMLNNSAAKNFSALLDSFGTCHLQHVSGPTHDGGTGQIRHTLD
jgi:hypothetical protein